ncbi:hypothetical protein L6452_14984 [Arctium lappa]|uniref:Uncharacterized protein n=1 Tax=Arctium lappa TaxID=4217 RepID=A0ACB9CMR1_ARCLA|nr:hypothetical protein L6452_14984 [Arctium lappa]
MEVDASIDPSEENLQYQIENNVNPVDDLEVHDANLDELPSVEVSIVNSGVAQKMEEETVIRSNEVNCHSQNEINAYLFDNIEIPSSNLDGRPSMDDLIEKSERLKPKSAVFDEHDVNFNFSSVDALNDKMKVNSRSMESNDFNGNISEIQPIPVDVNNILKSHGADQKQDGEHVVLNSGVGSNKQSVTFNVMIGPHYEFQSSPNMVDANIQVDHSIGQRPKSDLKMANESNRGIHTHTYTYL